MRIRCPECGKLNKIKEPFDKGTIKCGSCKNNHITLYAITAKMIVENIGKLNDIPKELANTVANIYFKFLNLTIYHSNPCAATADTDKTSNIMKSFESYIDLTASTMANFNYINESINGLREIGKNVQPNLYQSTVDYILDEYKYKINNVHKKRGIWRMIERKFKRVNEIPNLIDYLYDVR